MRVLRVLGYVVAVLLVIAATVHLLGALLPVDHVASGTLSVPLPQARVWQMINDAQSQPAWRKELTGVEAMPSRDGHPCWAEVSSMGRMPLCEQAAEAPSTRVVEILADKKAPFGGIWTYDLAPQGANSTRLTITERGFTRPWLYRFVGHYVLHEDYSLKKYEEELAAAH